MTGKAAVKIMIVNPAGQPDLNESVAEMARNYKDTSTLVTVASLGPAAGTLGALVECPASMTLLHAELVRACYHARRENYDALVINCVGDLAIDELRKIAGDMIIIGPAQCSVQTALRLGNRYSMIVNYPVVQEGLQGQVLRSLSSDQSPVSYRSIDMLYHEDKAELETRLHTQAKLAVENDGAEVVVLACTLALGWYQKLQKSLGVPVIDVAINALKTAEMSAQMKKRCGWGGAVASPTDEQLKKLNLMQEPYVFSGKIDIE